MIAGLAAALRDNTERADLATDLGLPGHALAGPTSPPVARGTQPPHQISGFWGLEVGGAQCGSGGWVAAFVAVAWSMTPTTLAPSVTGSRPIP